MSKKRKHSSCSLKDKLELLKRIDKGESATRLALEFDDFFFLHPVRISEALLYSQTFGLESVTLYLISASPRPNTTSQLHAGVPVSAHKHKHTCVA
jgi:hypothetical protein